MPAPPALHDLACVVHLHSNYSDGTGTVAEIAAAARRTGADVVLLTDHDTLEAKHRGEEGWHDGVLVLVGEEVSPKPGNHYLAFDIEREIDHRGLSARQICDAVRAAGGFGFAAHPFSRGSPLSKRAPVMPFDDLECEALGGIEVWSLATDIGEGIERIGQLVHFLARPERVLDHPPAENLREWDRLCQGRRIVGIGGLDAHQYGLRIGRFVPLRVMAYHRSFRHIRTHVLCDEPPARGEPERAREQVYA
ncbi:MAG TPA: PHP domain-containing protein, partial [Thermoleophilaceae bacterium]|nr:PHP domain-containing protein [Thermoleophilaceae bacterium]